MQEAIIESLSRTGVASFRGRRPTATDIDTLKKELAIITAKIKTSLFEGDNNMVTLQCHQQQSLQIIGNAAFKLWKSQNYRKPTTRKSYHTWGTFNAK
jgi:hypothetical protein